MKTFFNLFTIAILFAFLGNGYAQQPIPDYSKLPSIVKQPFTFNPSPNGTKSVVHTTEGFDNFFLGNDFGEPYIAVNPRDPLNMLCGFNINNVYYTLNGIDWTKNTPSFGSISIAGDPIMCYDSLGNLYYVSLMDSPSPYGLALVKSTNKGVSWSAPVMIYSTYVGLSDKEWITADQTAGPYSNYLYAGWRQFGSTGMRFTRSTDGGTTWSSPTVLSGDQGAYVTYGPNGSIQGGSVYFAATLGNYIAVYRSTDGGQTFGTYTLATSYIYGPGTICSGRYTMKNCIRTDYFPRMAADNSYGPNRGNVYVVYAGNPNTGTDKADIFLVRSTNYGQTWSTAIKVNDDNTTTDQWMPAVSCDKNTGRVLITWFDSRVDVTSNLMTKMYSAVSTNGGVSFMTNQPVSNVSFNPNNMAVGQGSGQANYMGDYIGNGTIGNSGIHVWMDARTNTMSSYVGYYPDFALTTSTSAVYLKNNDSATVIVKVPAIKGPFTERVKFTTSLDTNPTSGSLNITFQNGKDSITVFPDSLYLKIKSIGSVNNRVFKLYIKGSGVNGTPVHLRTVDIYMNLANLNIGTNREGQADFKVNGLQYNSRQNLILPTSNNVTVQALSPKVVGGSRFIFLNWSDSGDTTHTFMFNSSLTLTAFYKIQYKLILNSIVGNSFGGNDFTDSAGSRTFGVLSKFFTYNSTLYRFRGWTGSGVGSYTSADSLGNDTSITVTMLNPIVQTARWTPYVGISTISTEIPAEYKLYQNYPNPFNPETKIKFDVRENTLVTIKIYDMLGRDVATLVNEQLPAGKYVMPFNANSLSSGIYYYKITAGDFSEIRKMILLK